MSRTHTNGLYGVFVFCALALIVIAGCGGKGNSSVTDPTTRLKLAIVWPEYARAATPAEIAAPRAALSVRINFVSDGTPDRFTQTINRPADLSVGTKVSSGRLFVHRLTQTLDLSAIPVGTNGSRVNPARISLQFYSGANATGGIVAVVDPVPITIQPATNEPEESNPDGSKTHSFPRDSRGQVVRFSLTGKVSEIVFPSPPQVITQNVLADLKVQLKTSDGTLAAIPPGSLKITPNDPAFLQVVSNTLSNEPISAQRPLLSGLQSGITSVSVALESVAEINLDGSVGTPGPTITATGSLTIHPPAVVSITGQTMPMITGTARQFTATVSNLEGTGQSSDVVFTLQRNGVEDKTSFRRVNGRTVNFIPTLVGNYTLTATSVLKTANSAPIRAALGIAVLAPLSFDLTASSTEVAASATDQGNTFPPLKPATTTLTAQRNWIPIEGGVRWTIGAPATNPKPRPTRNDSGYFIDDGGPTIDTISPAGNGPKKIVYVAPTVPKLVTIYATSVVDPSAKRTITIVTKATSVGVTLN